MKRCFATCCITLIAIVETFGQQPPLPDVTRIRIDEISTKILSQKKDHTRIDLYRFFSAYFAQNNIYPTGDAIDLVEAYNKDSKIDEIMSGGKEFKSLQLPDVSDEVKAKMTADKDEVIKNKVVLNDELKAAISVFNKKKFKIYYRPNRNLSREFKDSLKVFGDKILPPIFKNSSYIDSLQIEFFITSLQQINILMDRVGDSGDPGKNTRAAIKELMDDFFSFEVPVAYHSLQEKSNGASDSDNPIHFSYAAYYPASSSGFSINNAQELPNANVYVYARGEDGKWSQEPKPNSYNVYYGANGFKYRLTPGCDTLSFFRYHPTVPASTLPVTLPRGSFCFVLQDITTHRLYVRPDINLRDNKVIDDKRLVKLCFKVEN